MDKDLERETKYLRAMVLVKQQMPEQFATFMEYIEGEELAVLSAIARAPMEGGTLRYLQGKFKQILEIGAEFKNCESKYRGILNRELESKG